MAAGDGFVETVDRAAEATRTPFYDRAREKSLAPLWRVLGGLVTDVPRSPAVPAHWAYAEVRPYLLEACDLISTEEAERRVLVLENPGLAGQSRITPSLFCGYQIILPGEIAPAHRHVASALRFIVEGKDAYTAVAGERTMMEPGDFVITPSWTWHDHGNISDAPMVWIDGLDMHMVNLFSASFREGYPGSTHPVVRPEGSAMALAGYNLLPADHESTSQTSPIFNYPYRRTREALDRLSKVRDPDACHGFKMLYINPVNGGSAMPTITTAMQLLPKGFATSLYRSTAGTVFSVVEGRGAVTVGDQRFVLEPKDLFVAPSWHPYRIEADEDLVLFSYSDRVVQEKLDLFREMRGECLMRYVLPPPPVTAVPVTGTDELFAVRRVYCVGRNYLEHVREMGGDERQPPFFFQKPTDAIVLDGAAIPYPPVTQDFHHEVELVLAIGRGGSDIAADAAGDHVFGAAVGIDLTRRDLQFAARNAGRPWEIGKAFDASAPIGAIVPLAGKGLPESGAISLSVNGETKQKGDLSQLIWSCAEIISQLSRQYRLEPGDLIFTGTPAGVGPMVPGDTVEARVEGLPPLSVSIVARV